MTITAFILGLSLGACFGVLAAALAIVSGRCAREEGEK